MSDVPETKTRFEGERIIPGMDAAEDGRWLAVVDAGLHGVSNSPYGTAAGAMSVVPPEIRTRVYGKTGTADTSPGMNSAWFAGWINDAAAGGGSPSPAGSAIPNSPAARPAAR